MTLYIDRVAFVNPQSKCRIRCLNGGVCAYKIKSPREHICICMEGYFEGTYCEKNIKSSDSFKDQFNTLSTTISPSSINKLGEYTIPKNDEKEDESIEGNEWNANEILEDDINKQENEINHLQQQYQSNNNDNISGYQQEDGTFDDDSSFENNNEIKQDENDIHSEEEEDDDDDDGEEKNLPYFDQNEDPASTEVYELHEDSKDDRFRNIPIMETTTINNQYTTPIHIKPKVNDVKTTLGPVNYYLHGSDNTNDDDDNGWMMVKKRNYAIRITNASPIRNNFINGIRKTFILTLFYIIYTKYF